MAKRVFSGLVIAFFFEKNKAMSFKRMGEKTHYLFIFLFISKISPFCKYLSLRGHSDESLFVVGEGDN